MHLNEYIDYDISLSATFICRGVETYSHTAGGAGRGGAATQAASGTNRFRLLLSAVYLLYMGSEILTGDASNPPLMNSE